jgi:predicted component of type VI protein secretion system
VIVSAPAFVSSLCVVVVLRENASGSQRKSPYQVPIDTFAVTATTTTNTNTNTTAISSPAAIRIIVKDEEQARVSAQRDGSSAQRRLWNDRLKTGIKNRN